MISALMITAAFWFGLEIRTDDAQFGDFVRRVGNRLVEVRKLEFKKPVDVAVLSREDLAEFIDTKMKKELAPGKIEKERLVLVKLGLIPPDLDLHKLYTELLGEQVAGMYDDESDKLYLIRHDGAAPQPAESVIVAHELTHALQDQYFDLEEIRLQLEDNDDMSLAFMAVVEGEATVAMMEYTIKERGANPLGAFFARKATNLLMGHMDMVTKLMGGLAGEKLSKAPNIIRKQLLFPYARGLKFVRYGIGANDWQRMHDMLRKLPKSTEQIMHPSKYFGDEPDWPTSVYTPAVGLLLPGHWHRASRSVAGEMATKVILSEYPPPLGLPEDGAPRIPFASAAALGWDGDEVNVYRDRSKPNDLLLTWYSTWDSEKDAREFEQALSAWVEQRYPKAKPIEGKAGRWSVAELNVRIERNGTDVLLIDGAHADRHDRIAKAIWRKTWKKEWVPKAEGE